MSLDIKCNPQGIHKLSENAGFVRIGDGSENARFVRIGGGCHPMPTKILH